MTNDDSRQLLRDQIRNADNHIAALKAWEKTNGQTNPFLRGLQERRSGLYAELATITRTKENNMPNIEIPKATLVKAQEELRAMNAAAAGRALTPAEQARWDELQADIEVCTRSIESIEEDARRDKDLASTRARWGANLVGGSGAETDPQNVARLDAGAARDAALRLLERSAAHLEDGQRDHLDKLIRREDSESIDSAELNRHIVLTSSEAYRSAFRKITGPKASTVVTLSERENAAVYEVQRSSMAEGSGSTGGYAVPAFLDPTIALNGQGASNPIRQLARNETITTKQWKGVGTTGVTWGFVAEGQPSTDSSPTVSQPTVDLFTARAWITYSIELQQDAVELDRQLFRLLGNGWEDTVAAYLATGTGSDQPKGIITALAAVSGSKVAITTAGSLAPADISKVWVSLPDRARESASWVMNESVREAVAAWGDEYGNRSVDLGGRLEKIRNRPVYSTEKFPAIATTTGSANQMVVGDFSGYLIAQRAGMTVEPVQTVVDGNGLPVGKRGMFAWARLGADVVDAGLLRLLYQ